MSTPLISRGRGTQPDRAVGCRSPHIYEGHRPDPAWEKPIKRQIKLAPLRPAQGC